MTRMNLKNMLSKISQIEKEYFMYDRTGMKPQKKTILVPRMEDGPPVPMQLTAIGAHWAFRQLSFLALAFKSQLLGLIIIEEDILDSRIVY